MRPRRLLYLGPYQPTLEAALVVEIASFRAADPLAPVFVLAPTTLLCRHLARHLAMSLPNGHAGIRFVTMAGLARILAERTLRGQGLAPLPPCAGTLLWRRTVARAIAPPDGGVFAPIGEAHGFPGAVRATVRDLKEAGLTPSVAERRAQGGGPLARKLRELAGIWRRMERLTLEAGFHDDLDLLREAAERAADSPALDGAAAMLYGFYDLPRSQRRLVAGFLAGRKVAAAFLPWAEDAAFDYAGPARDFLQGTLELTPAGDAPPPKPDPPYEVVAAPGETREAMEVARVVAAAACPLPAVGVLVRTAEQALSIDDAMEDAGIPRERIETRPASCATAARALFRLIEAKRDDLPRPTVIEIAGTLPVRFAVAPGAWDVFSREWGVVGGEAEWKTRVAAGIREIERRRERSAVDDVRGDRVGPAPDATRLETARALGAFVAELAEIVRSIPERGRWSELASALRSATSRLFSFEPGDGSESVEEGLTELAGLDRLAAAGEELGLGTLGEAVELLAAALDRAPDEDRDGDRGGALVADLMRARGLPFDLVVLPGMVEGRFPRRAHTDPLLSDRERRALNAVLSAEEAPFEEAPDDPPEDLGADGPLSLRSASSSEERLLFRLAVDAGRRVVFTLPRIDAATGRERTPSLLLLRHVEQASGAGSALSIEAFARAPGVRWLGLDPAPASRSAALTPIERLLADARDLHADPDPRSRSRRAAALLARSPFGRAAVAAERGRWGTRRFTAYDGWLEPAADAPEEVRRALASVALGGDGVLSATRLESWARCPYRYFLQHGLALTKLEEPERQMTLSPLDRGEIIHAALERFWRGERAAGRGVPDEGGLPSAQARIAAIADELLDRFEESGITGPAILWRQARAEIRRDLEEALRHAVERDSGVLPAAFELDFQEEIAGVGSIRGRIDRLDLSGDGRRGRIVDYKSGKSRLSFDGSRRDPEPRVFHGGEALQLPIYVLAAKRRFPEVADWVAAYDHCTQRGGFERAELSIDDATLERLRALIARLTADSAAGRFPFLQDDDACAGCDVAVVCGPGHDVAFAAKADDPALRALLARREEFR